MNACILNHLLKPNFMGDKRVLKCHHLGVPPHILCKCIHIYILSMSYADNTLV